MYCVLSVHGYRVATKSRAFPKPMGERNQATWFSCSKSVETCLLNEPRQCITWLSRLWVRLGLPAWWVTWCKSRGRDVKLLLAQCINEITWPGLRSTIAFQTVVGSKLLLRGSKLLLRESKPLQGPDCYLEGPKCYWEVTAIKFSIPVSYIVFATLNSSRRYLDLIYLSYSLLLAGLLFVET